MAAKAALTLAAVTCLASACSTNRVARGTFQREAPGDELFEAGWLSLEALGFHVDEADARAQQLHATRDGVTWALSVSALGTSQQLELRPATSPSRAALLQVLEPFEARVDVLLRAWASVPEWTFDGARNQLRVPGFVLEPPFAWRWLDFDLSHRRVVVQPRHLRQDPQLTLWLEVDRLRPGHQLRSAAQRAIGVALVAGGRLTFPDELQQGALRVLDGASAREVSWYGDETKLEAFEVRRVLVCPQLDAAACLATWRTLQERR